MAGMVVNTEFSLKQIVYLKTDVEQLPRIVVSFEICADGGIIYRLGCGTFFSTHYDCEISETSDQFMRLGIDKKQEQE